MEKKEYYKSNEDGVTYLVAMAYIAPSRGMSMPYDRAIVETCPCCGKKHEHGIRRDDGVDIIGVCESDCGNGNYIVINEKAIEYVKSKIIVI